MSISLYTQSTTPATKVLHEPWNTIVSAENGLTQRQQLCVGAHDEDTFLPSSVHADVFDNPRLLYIADHFLHLE